MENILLLNYSAVLKRLTGSKALKLLFDYGTIKDIPCH